MSTNLQRLALMAGITLTESAQAAEKKFQIKDTAGKVVKICYSKHEADQFISKNQDKRYHVRDVSSAKVTEAESNEVGWHVYDKNDKCVLGPTSEAKANAKAKELGGDEKGYTVGYTSDYSARRANEAASGEKRWFKTYKDWQAAVAKIDVDDDTKNTAHMDGELVAKWFDDRGEGWAKGPTVRESTGSNKVFDDYADWKNAAEKHGLEVFTKYGDAMGGKYEARKYTGTQAEVYGRFDKNSGDGWIHSSAMNEGAAASDSKVKAYRAWAVVKKLDPQSGVTFKRYAREKGLNPNATKDLEQRAKIGQAVKEDVDYDDEGNPIPEGPLPQGLIEIAQKLGFRTLDTQNSDSLDFKEVSAAGVKSALLAAYNLGKTQGTQQATPAASQPTSGTLPAPTSTTPADHQQIGR